MQGSCEAGETPPRSRSQSLEGVSSLRENTAKYNSFGDLPTKFQGRSNVSDNVAIQGKSSWLQIPEPDPFSPVKISSPFAHSESAPLLGSRKSESESAGQEPKQSQKSYLVLIYCVLLLLTGVGNSIFFKKMSSAMVNENIPRARF